METIVNTEFGSGKDYVVMIGLGLAATLLLKLGIAAIFTVAGLLLL